MFDRWAAKHRLEDNPARFRGIEAVTTRLEKPSLGRPPDYDWPGVEKLLKDYASQNGPIKNLNELLQKCGDFASELHPVHKTPDDKTIRTAIEKYSLDKAAGSSRGK